MGWLVFVYSFSHPLDCDYLEGRAILYAFPPILYIHQDRLGWAAGHRPT